MVYSMKKIKIGIVGCGRIAQQVHIPNYIQSSKSELVALCDKNKDELDRVSRKYNVKHVFENHQEMFESGLVEAVSVCVPTQFHSKVVVDAAAKGLHVLCEKPLADNLVEADRILEAATKNQITFCVGYNLRFLPNHRKVKEYIEKRKIGRPVFARANLITSGPYSLNPAFFANETEKRIGCLFDSGAHIFDLMLWLFGSPSQVSCYFSTHMEGVKVDDSALTSMKFPSGLLGEISVSWIPISNYNAMTTCRQIQVIGTQGILESDIFGPSFSFYSDSSLVCKIKGKAQFTPKKFDTRVPAEALDWSYKEEIEDFLESIASSKEPMVSGTEAREALRLTLAAYSSGKSRSSIDLDRW